MTQRIRPWFGNTLTTRTKHSCNLHNYTLVYKYSQYQNIPKSQSFYLTKEFPCLVSVVNKLHEGMILLGIIFICTYYVNTFDLLIEFTYTMHKPFNYTNSGVTMVLLNRLNKVITNFFYPNKCTSPDSRSLNVNKQSVDMLFLDNMFINDTSFTVFDLIIIFQCGKYKICKAKRHYLKE